jgi:hypothetical protein
LSWSLDSVTVAKLLDTVNVPSEFAVALPKKPPGRFTCDVTGPPFELGPVPGLGALVSVKPGIRDAPMKFGLLIF